MKDVREICNAAVALAERVPQPDVGQATDLADAATLHWNASFAQAAARLARTVMKMCDLQMLEVSLVERAMMELAANQAVLNSDPQLAIRYSLEIQAGNEQLVAILDKHGTGSGEGAERIAEVKDAADELRAAGFAKWPASSYPPLGMSAKQRFEKAGIGAFYETFYYSNSDLAHMSARALQRYLDGDFDDVVADAHITIATDLVLRVVIRANERLHAGLDDDIQELVDSFKKGLPHEDSN